MRSHTKAYFSAIMRWSAALWVGVSLMFSGVQAGEIPPAVNTGEVWRIVKPNWEPGDEKGFETFVAAIGNSDCDSLSECLKHPANPYRDTDKRSYFGDCADMVYVLRAYYAWKNGLVFSHQSLMAPLDQHGADARYSEEGNRIVQRRDAVGSTPINGPKFIAAISGMVSTAMFRTHPDGGKNKGGGVLYDDFYPVEITRENIRPGAVAYDIYGHVGLVYDIKDDGRILVIASHPDLSVTRTTYGANFLRAKPALGAGLKIWRPSYLQGATTRADGSYVGGSVRGVPNDQLANYSLEQFIGNKPDPKKDWRYGDFLFQGRTLGYYDFVRRRLADPNFAYNPVDELRYGLEDLCRAIQDRRAAVRRAIRAGVHKLPHPDRLPRNIYGTHGSWENYSTPSRDARLKLAFIELRRAIERYALMVENGTPGVRYDGDDLGGDLWTVWQEAGRECRIIYRRSDDTRVRLGIGHVMDRLFDLSFDPYHCPELRWGAKGGELETCPDSPRKRRWYDAQRYLRNQAQRTYDVRMDFTLEEIKPPSIAPPEEGGLGVEAPADADIRALLLKLSGKEQQISLMAP